MFSYIKGILEIKNTNYVVIDVNGVGFKIFMSQTAIDSLPEVREQIRIYTHMQVREDDISLYGFNTQEELRMFELLIGVSRNRSKISTFNACKYRTLKLCYLRNFR